MDPSGLLQGERIGACSDEAQLHFPRLMAASNGLGRIEMSYSNIIRTVYAQFTAKPTKKALIGWFLEYHAHFLLFPYRAASGAQWGQWDVPKKMLPKYKTAADLQSPPPPEAEFEAFLKAKVEARKNNYMTQEEDMIHVPTSGDFGKTAQIPEIPSSFPNTSEKVDVFPHGIGIGTGIGEQQKQNHEPSAPALAGDSHPIRLNGERYTPSDEDAESIWKLWPNRNGKQEGLKSIKKALVQLSTAGASNPVTDLASRVRAWLAWYAREKASGEFVPEIGYAQGWFGDKQRRYLDEAATPVPEPKLRLPSGDVVSQAMVEADGWEVVRGLG